MTKEEFVEKMVDTIHEELAIRGDIGYGGVYVEGWKDLEKKIGQIYDSFSK